MQRKKQRIASGVIAIALAGVSLLAFAPAAFAAAMTHVPPSSADAGRALDLSVNVTGVLDPTTVTLNYLAPDGSWKQIAYTHVSGGSVWIFTMHVPANEVRYPSISYYFTASDVGGTTRAPATGYYTVQVVNRVRATLINPVTGSPVPNAHWRLDLQDHSTQTTLADGTANSNGVIDIALPSVQSVLNAAASNGGYAVFNLRAFADLGYPFYLSETVSAPYGVTDLAAPLAGASVPLDSNLVGLNNLCDHWMEFQGQTPTGCHVGTVNTCPYVYEDQDMGRTKGEVVPIHLVYDTKGTMKYEQSADSSVEVALSMNAGPFQFKPGGQISNSQSLSATHYEQHELASPVEYYTGTFFDTWKLVYQDYPYTAPYCLREVKNYTTKWLPATNDQTIGDTTPTAYYSDQQAQAFNDECFMSCTQGPHEKLVMNSPGDALTVSTGHKHSVGASLCYAGPVGVCVTGRHGWGNSVSFTLAPTSTDCKQWYVYSTGAADSLQNPSEFHVDAGTAGSGTYTSAVAPYQFPNGCGPLKATT